jgi:hypothetical protein
LKPELPSGFQAPSNASNANRHPVDQLADVRAEIKRLEQRERQLRSQVIRSGDVTGDEFEGVIKRSTQQRVDVTAARRELGEVLRPFLRERPFEQLRIKKREEA